MPPSARRVVTPCGKGRNRTSAEASGSSAGRDRSSLGGRRGRPKNLSPSAACDGPRRRARRRSSSAPCVASDGAGSAPSASSCPLQSHASGAPLSSLASASLPRGSRGHSSARADGRARTTSCTPSGGKASAHAGASFLPLDLSPIAVMLASGPREVISPTGSSLGEEILLLSEAPSSRESRRHRPSGDRHPKGPPVYTPRQPEASRAALDAINPVRSGSGMAAKVGRQIARRSREELLQELLEEEIEEEVDLLPSPNR